MPLLLHHLIPGQTAALSLRRPPISACRPPQQHPRGLDPPDHRKRRSQRIRMSTPASPTMREHGSQSSLPICAIYLLHRTARDDVSEGPQSKSHAQRKTFMASSRGAPSGLSVLLNVRKKEGIIVVLRSMLWELRRAMASSTVRLTDGDLEWTAMRLFVHRCTFEKSSSRGSLWKVP